jgi:predicted double-glycine peptidase
MRRAHFFLIFALAAAGSAQNRDAEFARLADRYFDQVMFRFDPVDSTAAGFHQIRRPFSLRSES